MMTARIIAPWWGYSLDFEDWHGPHADQGAALAAGRAANLRRTIITGLCVPNPTRAPDMVGAIVSWLAMPPDGRPFLDQMILTEFEKANISVDGSGSPIIRTLRDAHGALHLFTHAMLATLGAAVGRAGEAVVPLMETADHYFVKPGSRLLQALQGDEEFRTVMDALTESLILSADLDAVVPRFLEIKYRQTHDAPAVASE